MESNKNLRPYQSVKRETGGIYCVRYYTENATVYKKQFFDSLHLWIRTEYFDKSIEGERLCTVSPKKIDGVIAIEKYFSAITIWSPVLLFSVRQKSRE